MTARPEFEDALNKVKKVVFLQRIRLKPSFLDFDKLRTGWVAENHFLAALSLCGLQKSLTPQELQELADGYKECDFSGKTGKLYKVHWVKFLDDVEQVFITFGLDKMDPLREVQAEPSELLDRQRYQRTTRKLVPQKEARVEQLLEHLQKECRIKGIQVMPAFDDARRAKGCRLVNHVTTSQFFQGLTKLGLGIQAEDAGLLAEKFGHESVPDMINIALFSRIADPPHASAA